MSASDYLEEEILDHIFGKGTYTPPTIHVALCTASIDEDDTGSTITEANYTGYSRYETEAADWSRSNSVMSNASALTFDECTAGSSTVSHVALVDASSGGNLLFYAQLSSNLSVSDGIEPYFAIGDITVTAS